MKGNWFRAFQGPADELAFVEEARLFGELLQEKKEIGAHFNAYFSAHFYNSNKPIEEIWFINSN